MSEEQLSAIISRLKEDSGLLKRLQSSGDLGAALDLVREAGFDVSEADLLPGQEAHKAELSDKDLERVTGGVEVNTPIGERLVKSHAGQLLDFFDDGHRAATCFSR